MVASKPKAPLLCASTLAALEGKVLCLTGGTSFIGSVVLRQILLECVTVQHIYVCIRQKNGLSIHARLKKLLEREIFDKVREHAPRSLMLVSPLEFDMSLKDAAQELPHCVHAIIHCARENFLSKASPKRVMTTNYGGLRLILDRASKIRASVVLLSSTMCLTDLQKECSVEETVYPLPIAHDDLYHQICVSGSRASGRVIHDLGFPSAHHLSYRMCELMMEEWHTEASLSSYRRRRSCITFGGRRPNYGGAILRTSDVIGLVEEGDDRGHSHSYSSSIIVAAVAHMSSGRFRPLLKETDLIPCVPADIVSSLVVGILTWLESRDIHATLHGPARPLAVALDFATANPFCVFHACSSGSRAPLTYGRFCSFVPNFRVAEESPKKNGSISRLLKKYFGRSEKTRAISHIISGFATFASNRRYEVHNTFGLELLLKKAARESQDKEWCFVYPSSANDWNAPLQSMCNRIMLRNAEVNHRPKPSPASLSKSFSSMFSRSSGKMTASSLSSSGRSSSHRTSILKYSDFFHSEPKEQKSPVSSTPQQNAHEIAISGLALPNDTFLLERDAEEDLFEAHVFEEELDAKTLDITEKQKTGSLRFEMERNYDFGHTSVLQTYASAA